MPDELVFYTNPMSRGRIVRWMLEEIGRPYRTELLDYDTTMKAPAYLAINPMGKVPAIRHGETVVTEAGAICAYLADAFPEARLAPPLLLLPLASRARSTALVSEHPPGRARAVRSDAPSQIAVGSRNCPRSTPTKSRGSLAGECHSGESIKKFKNQPQNRGAARAPPAFFNQPMTT